MQTVRVALFSPRNKPLLTTILSLNDAPRLRYVLDECADVPANLIDIAILTLGDAAGRELLVQARAAKPSIQILYLTRDEADVVPNKHVIAHKNLMAEFVATLNTMSAALPAAAHAKTAPLAAIAAVATTTAAGNVAEATPITPGVPSRQQRIRLRALLVDAGPTVNAQLVQVVESIGMTCDAATSGRDALRLLAGNAYNIIYIDIALADMDGYKLTKELKRNPTHRDTSVILLAGQTTPFDAKRGAAAGCTVAVTKPVELQRFYTTTVEALSKNIGGEEVSNLTRDPTVTLPVRR